MKVARYEQEFRGLFEPISLELSKTDVQVSEQTQSQPCPEHQLEPEITRGLWQLSDYKCESSGDSYKFLHYFINLL